MVWDARETSPSCIPSNHSITGRNHLAENHRCFRLLHLLRHRFLALAVGDSSDSAIFLRATPADARTCWPAGDRTKADPVSSKSSESNADHQCLSCPGWKGSAERQAGQGQRSGGGIVWEGPASASAAPRTRPRVSGVCCEFVGHQAVRIWAESLPKRAFDVRAIR